MKETIILFLSLVSMLLLSLAMIIGILGIRYNEIQYRVLNTLILSSCGYSLIVIMLILITRG